MTEVHELINAELDGVCGGFLFCFAPDVLTRHNSYW